MPEVPTPLEPALDVADTAAILKCHPKTVERMIRARRLNAVKVGARWRIRREDVAAYLSGGDA